MTEIEQLERDLIAWEAQAEGFRRAERWNDLADIERRIELDAAKLEGLQREQEA